MILRIRKQIKEPAGRVRGGGDGRPEYSENRFKENDPHNNNNTDGKCPRVVDEGSAYAGRAASLFGPQL